MNHIKSPQSKLIVVLGMHRCGTSAITRCLAALGADLGENLIPAAADNPKGFFEDQAILEINEEILAQLKLPSWHSLNLPDIRNIEKQTLASLQKKARTILEKKANSPISAIKDPRMALLLDFWLPLFEQLALDVSYVIAVRHPSNVADSISKRDKLEPLVSYYLWLAHFVNAVLAVRHKPYIVINYDILLENPDSQLKRIAQALQLEIEEKQVRIFKEQFLDHSLRHFNPNHLLSENNIPLEVLETYYLIKSAAQDSLSLNSEKIIEKFTRIQYTIKKTGSLLLSQYKEKDHQSTLSLEQALLTTENLSQQLAADLETQKQINIELASQLAQSTYAMRALKMSRSWQLTAPLRAFSNQIKLLSSLIKLSGGKIALAKQFILYFSMNPTKFKQFAKMAEALIIPAPWELGASQYNNSPSQLNHSQQQLTYPEWIKRHYAINDSMRHNILEKINKLEHKPIISVIMPVYNPSPSFLEQAIASVCKQLYPHWELCIADDASPNPAIRELLESAASKDARINVVYHQENGHISAASNSALALATGEFIALLDHDDLLSEDALFWVAEAINRYPDAGLIYSDEDKISIDGERKDPYFKSDFNYDLLLSQNMISHLGIYRRSMVKQIGGFRLGFEGSQDYDLALRTIEQINRNQIIHIPRILYHWRIHPESTANSANAKPYAILAAERSINQHLQRIGVSGKVSVLAHGYRVDYAPPENPPLLSIIIPTRDRADLLAKCINSILSLTTYKHYEIIIIDNGSVEEKTLTLFDNYISRGIKIIHDNSPFNYSRLNNTAVSYAQGEVLCLMNNDIEILTPHWIEQMLTLALRPNTGCVGALLWYPNHTIQHAGVILGIGSDTEHGGVAGHSHHGLPKGEYGYFGRAMLCQELSAVTGACLMVRKSIYQQVNGLDEQLTVAFNDVDFCLRVKAAGYYNVFTPYAEMIHYESASRGVDDTPEKQKRAASEVIFMRKRWGNDLLNDPAYNPNLSFIYSNFSLAWPPRTPPL